MPSRVPDAIMYGKGQQSINSARSQMIKNQEQALTGKKINRLSEDPAGTIQVLHVKTMQERDETVSSNLELANSFLSVTDSALGELTEVLSRAKELAIQMSSTTNQTPDAREAVQKEAEQLAMRAVQISNSRLGDKYIFAGYQMNKPPFDTAGNYFGDTGNFEIEMDRGQRIAINVPGVLPFFGVSEITGDAQQSRENPGENTTPSISGTLREPASIPAKNKGVDPLVQPDAFQALKEKSGINLFQAFNNFTEGLKTGESRLINESVENFEKGFKQVISARAMMGARQNVVSLSLNSLENSKVVNAELRSNAEDADSIKVYSDLAKNENVLNATLDINKKLITHSLLDFLK